MVGALGGAYLITVDEIRYQRVKILSKPTLASSIFYIANQTAENSSQSQFEIPSNSPENLIFTKTQIVRISCYMASHAAALKVGLALLGLSMVGYILGPPLYWHLTEALAAVSHSSAVSASSCPLCDCDCSSQHLLTIPKGIRSCDFYLMLRL